MVRSSLRSRRMADERREYEEADHRLWQRDGRGFPTVRVVRECYEDGDAGEYEGHSMAVKGQRTGSKYWMRTDTYRYSMYMSYHVRYLSFQTHSHFPSGLHQESLRRFHSRFCLSSCIKCDNEGFGAGIGLCV